MKCVIPALAINARTGHPHFKMGKKNPDERVGHPPRTGHPHFKMGKKIQDERVGHPPEGFR
jgi:hypothetical protein